MTSRVQHLLLKSFPPLEGSLFHFTFTRTPIIRKIYSVLKSMLCLDVSMKCHQITDEQMVSSHKALQAASSENVCHCPEVTQIDICSVWWVNGRNWIFFFINCGTQRGAVCGTEEINSWGKWIFVVRSDQGSPSHLQD